jgi:hypothetical protein
LNGALWYTINVQRMGFPIMNLPSIDVVEAADGVAWVEITHSKGTITSVADYRLTGRILKITGVQVKATGGGLGIAGARVLARKILEMVDDVDALEISGVRHRKWGKANPPRWAFTVTRTGVRSERFKRKH